MFENEPAGYVAGHRTTRHGCEGELQWLNFADEMRGKGVSDAVIRKMMGRLVSNAIHRICVNVDPDNICSRSVYFRHGAVELDAYWLFWPDLRSYDS